MRVQNFAEYLEAKEEDYYAVWDGKNLAIIQTVTGGIPRRNGRPAVEVDKDWNLRVLDVPVPVGSRVYPDGRVGLT